MNGIDLGHILCLDLNHVDEAFTYMSLVDTPIPCICHEHQIQGRTESDTDQYTYFPR